MENTNFKRFFLAPVLGTALVGAGYGISKAVKTQMRQRQRPPNLPK